VIAADRDWRAFTPMYGVDLDDTTDYFGEGTPAAGFFLGHDPPRHYDVRRIFQTTFLPKGLEPVQGSIQRKVDELIAGFIARGEVDLAEEFATPLPNDMTADMLGFSRSEQTRLTELLGTFIARDAHDTSTIPQEGLEAATELKARCARVLEERRKAAGRDDLIGDMLEAEIESEPLPDDEIVSLMFFLFTADADTVKGLLTNALYLLERHPEQRAGLVRGPVQDPERHRGDPALRVPSAVDEKNGDSGRRAARPGNSRGSHDGPALRLRQPRRAPVRGPGPLRRHAGDRTPPSAVCTAVWVLRLRGWRRRSRWRPCCRGYPSTRSPGR
jgi:cytochrome P450